MRKLYPQNFLYAEALQNRLLWLRQKFDLKLTNLDKNIWNLDKNISNFLWKTIHSFKPSVLVCQGDATWAKNWLIVRGAD